MSDQRNEVVAQESTSSTSADDESDLSTSGQTFDAEMHESEGEADDRFDG